MTSRLLAAILVLAAGAGLWWLLRPSAPDVLVGSADLDGASDTAVAPRDVAPVREAPVASEPAARIERDAVASEGERLPPIDVSAVRLVRFRPEQFRDGPDFSGHVLLEHIVESRVAWVRWDAAATRARFRAATIRMQSPVVLEEGEVGMPLDALVAVIREAGFSARLDGSTLRIGAEGVYPDEAAPSPR